MRRSTLVHTHGAVTAHTLRYATHGHINERLSLLPSLLCGRSGRLLCALRRLARAHRRAATGCLVGDCTRQRGAHAVGGRGEGRGGGGGGGVGSPASLLLLPPSERVDAGGGHPLRGEGAAGAVHDEATEAAPAAVGGGDQRREDGELVRLLQALPQALLCLELLAELRQRDERLAVLLLWAWLWRLLPQLLLLLALLLQLPDGALLHS